MTLIYFYDRIKTVIKMIIYLIRHAQTVHNKKGKVFSGKSDVLLSDKGKEEAGNLKKSGILKDVKEIYITPLTRTRQTADILFPEEIPRHTVKELAEMDFGDYEGRILEEENTEDEVFSKWMNDPESLTFPKGDSFKDHAEEAFKALKDIAEKSNEDCIAVISHATTIRLIITQLLGKSLNTFREIPCENCSVTKVVYEKNVLSVEAENLR